MANESQQRYVCCPCYQGTPHAMHTMRKMCAGSSVCQMQLSQGHMLLSKAIFITVFQAFEDVWTGPSLLHYEFSNQKA